MTPQSVIIFGGKGTAVNLAEQIEDARRRFNYPMRVIGFAIDDPTLGNEIAGFPVVTGTRTAWHEFARREVSFLYALYRPDVMRRRSELLAELGVPAERFANFIHPLAYVAPSVRIGRGNAVLAHATVMHGVSLGSHGIFNSSTVVEHDSRVGDCAFLAAGAVLGSRVTLGKGVFVGLNAAVREAVAVGDYAFVGMGSVVVRDVPPGAKVFGSPARAPR
jgi:sugar O-acyltransferase (sialic acid O-acetyltransferase NeuD family)